MTTPSLSHTIKTLQASLNAYSVAKSESLIEVAIDDLTTFDTRSAPLLALAKEVADGKHKVPADLAKHFKELLKKLA